MVTFDAKIPSKVKNSPAVRGNIVITSALPYANGEIHLGHITSTYLPADILARYLRSTNHKVLYLCGSDDYGTPILVKAEKENKSPEDYVKFWNERDQKDFKKLGISFDIFYKTSSPENIKLSQEFFRILGKRGFIFKKTVSQPYCEHDKKFLPDRYVKGTCPHCNATEQYSDGCEKCGRALEPGEIKNEHCAICGRKPVKKESEHYFLRLSAFSKELRSWLLANENLQEDVKNYVLKWIDEGLKEWDITRDIPWGVPVPGDDKKVFYGWFDNAIGYAATAIKYFGDEGRAKKFWNSAKIYHYIGKDIVYHHYLFMTAIRLITKQFKEPDYIPTRGHLLLQNQKFSKSRGWYISLEDFLNEFPADYLRYYLSSITTYSQQDINFDWKEFQSKINNELVANVGNFVNRTLTFTNSHFDGKIPEPENEKKLGAKSLDRKKEILNRLEMIPALVGEGIESNHHDRSLKKILEFSSACNNYFQSEEPWNNKNNKTCLYVCANACRTLAILLEPFLPFSSEKILGMLNAKKDPWSAAGEFKIKPGHKIRKAEILFNKVEDDAINKRLQKLGGVKELLDIEDFKKLDIRIGKVLSAENVPKSEKLLKLQIDIGNETRQCVAGMAKFYNPQDLVGKDVVVVANLKPVKFMGLESQCMLLAAEKGDKITVLKPDKDVGQGALIR
ncbi:MAG: methionine--tRNA ligase [Candidatus Aenigmarchaeota archaeon]|nr:methionine--tRNA ligase [Candidatus Aenigmarchaeota archaeon]